MVFVYYYLIFNEGSSLTSKYDSSFYKATISLGIIFLCSYNL